MMEGTPDRSSGDERWARLERWQREAGQIIAATTRGRPNQSGDDERRARSEQR
jgi:hypothetical protein